MKDSPELVLDGRGPMAQQIEEQIRWLVRSGGLRPGEELPTIRALAVGLAVNPHVIEEAYQRLERAGLLTGDDAGGPYVVGPSCVAEAAELKRLCRLFLQEAAERGHSVAAVLHALGACLLEEVDHGQAH